MVLLPLENLVRLNNGNMKLMIISRAPLYEQDEDGVIGYFDYSACIYPTGQVENQAYFFNKENIDKVYFEGYKDEQEKLFQKQYEEKIKEVQYPKLSIDD